MPIFRCVTMLFACVACVVSLSGCAPGEDEAGAGSPGAPLSGAVEVAAPSPMPDGALVAETESGAITAESLVGTTWVIADYSVSFEAEGVVSFNSGSKGTWALMDGTITIAAADEETVISVEGEQLVHNGMALERQ